MSRLFHFLLIALLVAVLPLRGYAAVTMQKGGAPAPAATTHDHVAMHDAMQHGEIHHEGMQHEHAAPADTGASHHASHDSAGNNCGSYCGDCCSTGALQSLPLVPQTLRALSRVNAAPAAAPASFVADLPVPPPNRLAA